MPASFREFHKEAGLRTIFVPHSLDGEVEQISEWVFGTRDIDRSLYDYTAWVQEAATGDVDDYLMVGQAGHGIQSYAMHYYLVEGSLALFLQLAWGGAYSNSEAERAIIAEQFGLIPQLYSMAHDSNLPTDARLVVALSDYHGVRWAVLPDSMSKQEFLEYGDWQTDDILDLRTVLDWLNDFETD